MFRQGNADRRAKVRICLGKETLIGKITRKYCPGNNQSDFIIGRLRRHILCGHVIILDTRKLGNHFSQRVFHIT